jgi:hypothetical protein
MPVRHDRAKSARRAAYFKGRADLDNSCAGARAGFSAIVER